MEKKHKYALITGASSGIGAEFAKQLSTKGYTPILVARREERLKELADALREKCKVESIIIPTDLSATNEVTELFEKIKEYPVGIFINNAGFGDCGYFMEGDLNKELSMIDVNVKACHTVCKLALLKLKEQGGGYLLNVASSAGLLPAGPYMATYYASKAYVTSLTRAIAYELKEADSKIYVGALCPGPVDTEFNDVAEVSFALKGITPEFCVSEAIRGMIARKVIIVPQKTMELATDFSRLLPEKTLIKITAHQQKKKFQN